MKHASSILRVLFIFGLFAVPSCTSAPKPQAPSVDAGSGRKELVAPPALTREEAILRAKQIAGVSYILWFGLDGVHPDFEGRVVATFELRNRPKDLAHGVFLDFEGGKVLSIRLNGTTYPVDGTRYDGRRIRFRSQEIQPGMNRAEIAFSHPYGSGGAGFNRFLDPVDSNAYLYSNINPHGAHFVFPCFDQPDLRASFELTVETPDGWEVAANTKERDSVRVDGHMSWAFPPSPKLSTSVFALHAGPYSVLKDEAEGIAMRLLFRKSLAKFAGLKSRAKDWFSITGKGLEFFSVQFAYPYPYSKFDQVFVPDSGSRVISSAGAVLYDESRLIAEVPPALSVQDRSERSDLIFHELAHMWFGNLVTPRWWHSLWFYQSLADFMSAWGQSDPEGLASQREWPAFLREKKLRAYARDLQPDARALELSVSGVERPDDGVAGQDADKAAALLKQLRYFAGDDEFRDGIQRFFIKYALRNAGLPEFFKILSEAAGDSMASWHRAWLQTPGMNSLRADWACQDVEQVYRNRKRIVSRISRFTLVQGLVGSNPKNQLRPHRTTIAVYERGGAGRGLLKPAELVEAYYTGAETQVRALVGKPCPDFVFPNYNDHDYVKVELDGPSTAFARENLRSFGEPLMRQQLLAIFGDQLREQKWALGDFATFMMSAAKSEKDPGILSWILGSLTDSSVTLPDPAAVGNFVVRGLRTAAAGSEAQFAWWNHWMNAPEPILATSESVKLIRDLLKKKVSLPGFRLDEGRRQQLEAAMARTETPAAQSPSPSPSIEAGPVPSASPEPIAAPSPAMAPSLTPTPEGSPSPSVSDN